MNALRAILTGILTLSLAGMPTGATSAGPADSAPALTTDIASVLGRSQVSYRAEGGFTGVESYGVIISCVNGDVSMMASIHDPRLPAEPMRKIGRIPRERYLELWNSLVRQAALRLDDGPVLDRDVLDEFTVTFNLSVGETSRRFRAQGLSLPECARFQAVRSLIDEAADMASLWAEHDQLAGITPDDDRKVTFETLHSSLELLP